MGNKRITVPRAGVSKSFKMSGNTIKVAGAPSYKSSQVAPKLSFNQEGELLPLELRAQWPFYSDSPFDSIVITGTSQSAGDELFLISLPGCYDPKVGAEPSEVRKVSSGNSDFIQMDGTVKQLASMSLQKDGSLPSRIYIAASGNDILYRSNDGNGSDPSAGGNESFKLTAGADPVEIIGIDLILDLRFINAVGGETPNLVYWPIY